MRKIGIILALVVLIFLQSILPPKSGPVVLVGGGHIPEAAIVWLKERALSSHFLVITYGEHFNDPMSRWIRLLGDVTFCLPENFGKTPLIDIGAIIIDGGDQWEYLRRLNGRAIEAAHKLGIPILGTSAGAMILGEYCFTAEHNSITSEEACIYEDRVTIKRHYMDLDCLANVIIDTHFEQRKRDGRLAVFLKKSRAKYGIGIDEETAICIERGHRLIVGKGTVKILR